jgi:exopolysaccharide production protein ExoZ
MRERSELMGLQALRGIAALLVVAHHTAGTLALAKYGDHLLAGGLFGPMGRAGVDLFFVLSGFIIYYVHYTYIGCPRRLRNYGIRRLARIYPTFWVALAIVTVPTLIYHPSEVIGDDASIGLLRSALLLPITNSDQSNIVGVAWTLSHELLFYTLFGFLILSRRVGVAVFAVWCTALLGARFFSELAPPLNFLLHVKNLEFLMGVTVAKLLLETPRRAGWWTLASGAALFVATGVVELRGGYDFLESWPTLFYGAAAALMIFALASLEEEHRIVRIPRPLVFAGAASYSIYLIHFTLVVGLVKAAHSAGLTERLPALLLFFMIAAAATAGGVVLYLAVERRLVRFAQRLVAPPGGRRVVEKDERPLRVDAPPMSQSSVAATAPKPVSARNGFESPEPHAFRLR